MREPQGCQSLDCEHIHMERPDDVGFWTGELGVTEQELRELVAQVGDGVDAVVDALRD